MLLKKVKREMPFVIRCKKKKTRFLKTSIDISAIPVAYDELFKKLFDGLKPVQ